MKPADRLNKILGTANPSRMFKDNDKDKVPNVFDCKPNNPKKQGIVHKIGATVARHYGAERTAERIEAAEERSEARKETRRAEKAEIEKIRLTERKKQALQTAKFREEERGRRRREFIKRGGIGGQVTMAIGKTMKQVSVRPRAAPRVRRKGKKGKRRTRRTVRAAPPRRTLADFDKEFKINI